MKKTLSISVTALLLLSLVGCAGEGTPQPTVTVTETVTAEPSPEPSETSTEDESGSSTEKSSGTGGSKETKRTFESHGTSERGNLIKHVGDWAGIGPVGTEDMSVTFKIDKIELGAKCTSSYAEKPKYDQFVALEISIETFPELKDNGGDFSMSSFDFGAFTSDGTRINDTQGNSWACEDVETQIPSNIGPGEKVKGRIILDLPKDASVITFSSYLTDGTWEWPLADTKDA